MLVEHADESAGGELDTLERERPLSLNGVCRVREITLNLTGGGAPRRDDPPSALRKKRDVASRYSHYHTDQSCFICQRLR